MRVIDIELCFSVQCFMCSLAPGGVSERILARKGAFDEPDRDLAGGVRCSAAAQALKEISRSALKWIKKTWLAKFVKKC